jgi:hypothetical protein
MTANEFTRFDIERAKVAEAQATQRYQNILDRIVSLRHDVNARPWDDVAADKRFPEHIREAVAALEIEAFTLRDELDQCMARPLP